MIRRLRRNGFFGLIVLCGCSGNPNDGTAGANAIPGDAPPISWANLDSGADVGDSPRGSDLAPDTDPDTIPETMTDVPAESESGVGAQLCTEKCGVLVQIDCPDRPTLDDCVRDCVAMASVCPSTSTAYDECIVANGSAGLACDDVVERTVLLPQVCPQVQEDFIACELGIPQGPPTSGPSRSIGAWLRLLRPLPAKMLPALR